MPICILSGYSVSYIEEFWRDKPDCGDDDYLDLDHEYQIGPEGHFDRSDMAMINQEYQNGKAIVVKDLANKTHTSYTQKIH